MDPHEALTRGDLSYQEIRRRAGGSAYGSNDVVRQRLAGLLEPSAATEDPASESDADDARGCGALIVRLGGTATVTAIAEWMGWTLERSQAALAELDRRLDRCGLQVFADLTGGLLIRERVRLRTRPHRFAIDLAQRLDFPDCAHALSHLVRGDHCATNQDWMQPLLDLGAAVTGRHPAIHPTEIVATAFAGVRRRAIRLPAFLHIVDHGNGCAEMVSEPPSGTYHGGSVPVAPVSSCAAVDPPQ